MTARPGSGVVFFCTAIVLTAGNGLRAAPVNGGTVGVAANYHPGGANATEQERIASTHDLVVLGTGWADDGPPSTYYEANPGIVAIVYQSWFDTSPSHPDYEFVNQHEDWFYHDERGSRVAVYGTHESPDCDPVACPSDPSQCNCRFGMNLGHPDYRQFVATRFSDIVTAGGAFGGDLGFDGIFLDNTFPNWPYRPAKVTSGWVSATPVRATGSTQTEDDWLADQIGFLETVNASLGDSKLLIFNGCIADAGYPRWKEQSYAFLEHADGCTKEYWTVNGADQSATSKLGTSWEQDVGLFEGVTRRGKWAVPLIGSGVHSAAVNRYGIASLFLIRQDEKTFMNFWRGTALEAIAGRFSQTFPEASVDLGPPVEDYVRLSNGVASRRFSDGRVLVNPTTATQTVALDRAMRTIEGAVISVVVMPSGTAEILLPEAAPGEPPPTVEQLRRMDGR